MPELPEVETIRRQLEAELVDYTFLNLKTDNEKMFRPNFKVVNDGIKGSQIESISRQAKLLIFNLSNGLSLLFHLKLTGRLLVRKPSDPADDYVHVVFTLSGNNKAKGAKELRFADARKFGFVKLMTDAKDMETLLSGYGPEPLKDLTLKKFKEILKSSSRPIKIVLMDQEKISGIGNIYANDALWLAKIQPQHRSNELGNSLVEKLYEAVLEVLRRGLKYGGASDQWYRQVHGEEGKYQEHFLVYGKGGETCERCGKTIKRIEVGGRGTFYCPNCQKS